MFCAAITAVTCAGAAGCYETEQNIDTSKTQIYVSCYDSGVDSGWIKELAEKWNASNDKYQIMIRDTIGAQTDNIIQEIQGEPTSTSPTIYYTADQLNPMELATESFACLSRTAGAYMYKQFQQICRDLELAPSRVVEYPAMEDVLFAVECGQALAIMPYHIREYMKTDLAFVPLDGQNLTIDIGVAWRSPTDNPAVGWFVELINHSLVERPELF